MTENEAAPTDFELFLGQVSDELSHCGGTLLQRHSPNARAEAWDFSFRRAGCLYQVRFDGVSNTLSLEKGLGSFSVNTKPGWRPMETRELVNVSFPDALEAVRSFLSRFAPRA